MGRRSLSPWPSRSRFISRSTPEEILAPKCPLLMATGLKCPGCGSQRMLHAPSSRRHCLRMEIQCPVVPSCAIPDCARRGVGRTEEIWPAFYRRINSIPVIVAVTAVIIGWFVLRNFILPDL